MNPAAAVVSHLPLHQTLGVAHPFQYSNPNPNKPPSSTVKREADYMPGNFMPGNFLKNGFFFFVCVF
jgi:hypothetical protein